jgi:hypothetical protein
MAKKETQKIKGCKKCGRSKNRQARAGSPISLFVRGKITAQNYFSLTGPRVKAL